MSRSVTLMPCTHAHMFLHSHTHSRAQGEDEEDEDSDDADFSEPEEQVIERGGSGCAHILHRCMSTCMHK